MKKGNEKKKVFYFFSFIFLSASTSLLKLKQAMKSLFFRVFCQYQRIGIRVLGFVFSVLLRLFISFIDERLSSNSNKELVGCLDLSFLFYLVCISFIYLIICQHLASHKCLSVLEHGKALIPRKNYHLLTYLHCIPGSSSVGQQ